MPDMKRVAREKAIRFGRSSPLVGVLTEPESRGRPPRPAVILLNSGPLHRAGPSRLHVQIARELAHHGFISLRFDFSGFGDSASRSSAPPLPERASSETREAMDFLVEKREVEHFVLLGISSGAELAFRSALGDSRIIGLAQLDAPTHPTLRSRCSELRDRVLQRPSWKTAWLKLLRGIAGAGEAAVIRVRNAPPPALSTQSPARRIVAAGVRELLARGVHLFYFFPGGPGGSDDRRQDPDALPDVGSHSRVRIEYGAEGTGDGATLRQQEELVQRIRTWMLDSFDPLEEPAPPRTGPLRAASPSLVSRLP